MELCGEGGEEVAEGRHEAAQHPRHSIGAPPVLGNWFRGRRIGRLGYLCITRVEIYLSIYLSLSTYLSFIYLNIYLSNYLYLPTWYLVASRYAVFMILFAIKQSLSNRAKTGNH